MAFTTPRTWVPGEVLTASLLNTHLRDNLLAMTGAWDTYTPTWTSTGGGQSLGNGSLTGRYTSAGKTVHFYISFSIGSTTALGSGRWDFALPKTAIGYAALGHLLGVGSARDTGVRVYRLDSMFVDTGKVTGWRDTGATEAVITPTTPFTFAAGDSITLAGTYEAA